MKVSYFETGRYASLRPVPPDWPAAPAAYDREAGAEAYRGMIERVECAESIGFDWVSVSEHHYSPRILTPAPIVSAAYIAARVHRIKIALLGPIIPQSNPVRVAEELAMLDTLSQGRLVAGLLRGTSNESLTYDLNPTESRERLNEAWDLVVKAWTTHEPFAWQGKYWSYERVSIWPRPLQQPHPPIVLPADSDEGLETAARRRVGTGAAYRSNTRVKTVFDRYRSFAAKHGWTPTAEHCHVLRHVYVAETNARAREEAEPHLDYFWTKLLSYHRGSMKLLGQTPVPRPASITRAEDLPLYELDFDLTQREGLTLVGDPDYLIREIKAQMRELGAGVLMGLFQFGSMPHAMAKKNIALFARTVLPELKRS